MRCTVTISRNFRVRAKDLTTEVISALAECPRRSVRRIREEAASEAPVDTGALSASLYVADDRGSDYARHAAAARYLRHEGNRPNSPAVVVPEAGPDKPLEAIVASAAAHAIYNEYGSGSMAARPFLVPAVANDAETFFREVKDALRRRKDRPEEDDQLEEGEGGEAADGALAIEGEGGLGLEAVAAEAIEAAPLLLLL